MRKLNGMAREIYAQKDALANSKIFSTQEV
jgi:hypothetical protein